MMAEHVCSRAKGAHWGPGVAGRGSGARRWFLFVAGCLALVGGCGNRQQGKSGPAVIRNCGSDTMVNVAQMWAEEYRAVAPDVSVEVSGGGSGVGLRDLIEGIIDMANSSREMKPAEKEQARQKTGKDPVEHIVGYDAVSVYVHRDNPVEQLTLRQLADIYGEGGKTEKWSQLGISLPRGSDEIVRVSRQNSSGTYFFFREHVLDKKDFKMGSQDMSGSKDVVELVGRTRGAIGYSGMGYKTEAVKFVKIAVREGEPAYEPSLENVQAGKYSLARSLLIYTLGPPEGPVKKYLDWILSPAGQKVLQEAGYLPVAAVEKR